MKMPDLSSPAAMLVLLAPFIAGVRLRLRSSVHRRGLLSCAAGIAIAYVFMDPTQRSFAAAPEGRGLPLPEFHVYGAALVGFAPSYSIHSLVGYCGLMSYLLITNADRNLVSCGLYFVGMFFHFLSIGYSLRVEHPAVPGLLGFIAAGVVINSLRAGLPKRDEGLSPPFLAGEHGGTQACS
jgi:hypothetical protein